MEKFWGDLVDPGEPLFWLTIWFTWPIVIIWYLIDWIF
jgi:hypothetical protein